MVGGNRRNRKVARDLSRLVEKLTQCVVKLRAVMIVVSQAGEGQELFRLRRGGKKAFALREGDETIGGAVGQENGARTLADLGKVVKATAHQPAGRQPGKRRLSHV